MKPLTLGFVALLVLPGWEMAENLRGALSDPAGREKNRSV